MVRLFYILLLIVPQICLAQTIDLKNFDYFKADSIAINFPKKKYKSVIEIVAPLTENLKTEQEKFRAIFRWITENIEYNKSASSTTDPDKVVRRNKAVCQGFANLLKDLCESAHIECKVVVGYTKTDYKDINRKLNKTDHAWNIVKLNDKNYLVDVTWATSKYNVVTRKFEKDFDEHYYLTPPDKFILDHIPENKIDQLLEKPLTKKQFSRFPLLYADYFHLGIEKIYPMKGMIKHDFDNEFKFKFESLNKITSAHILVDADKYMSPIELNGNEFSFKFEKTGKQILTVYLDGKAVAEYIVIVK
jgi:transglutaminase/protease-like cytokinesis protein 3